MCNCYALSLFQYTFSDDIYSGVVQPLLTKIKETAASDSKFKLSECFQSKHLFYKNLLEFSAKQESAHNETDIAQLLTRYERRNQTLLADVEYYLKRVNQTYDPMIRNRTAFEVSAELPRTNGKRSKV